MSHSDQQRGEFTISSDPSRLDLDAIYSVLRSLYWCQGIPRETLAKAIDHSLCFGLYAPAGQIGFARVITDRATFAYLCDVYVLEEYRGRGLGKWLIDSVMAHPDLQGLRRFVLVTRDAHELYRPFGFREPANPARYMERHDPDVYLRPSAAR